MLRQLYNYIAEADRVAFLSYWRI